MFIDNVQFRTSLTDINNIRYLLFTTFYNNDFYIERLKEIINRNIECLGIDYSPNMFSFIIKIKKTAMRKLHGFKNDPNFYYQTIPNIFKEFISTNESDIVQVLGTVYENPRQVLEKIYDNHYIMANLCHVTCIADNIVIIKL